jgi:hypothetical protein
MATSCPSSSAWALLSLSVSLLLPCFTPVALVLAAFLELVVGLIVKVLQIRDRTYRTTGRYVTNGRKSHLACKKGKGVYNERKGVFMRTFGVVVGLAVALTAGFAFADDLMNAYRAEYDKITAQITSMSAMAKKDCDATPPSFCVSSVAAVGRYAEKRDDLKLRVLEKYGKLPEWWTE